MAKQLFDYSKYGPRDYTYYGFHLKNGRYHIDTKRLKKLGYSGYFPEELFAKSRNTHYFVPRHKKVDDYAINILLAMVNKLTSIWNTEYKDAINGLKTPKQVKDEVRTNMIMTSSSPKEDMDEIEFTSLREGIRREGEYDDVVRSIHLQYIQKIFAEYFRAILLVLRERGYKEAFDFEYYNFCEYVQEKTNAPSQELNPLFSLPHFKYFDLLSKINNFLKHNTKRSYLSLARNSREKDLEHKKFLASFVCSEQEAKMKYESGTYAGYWLKIDSKFIDEILKNLYEFSKELCELLYNETASEASWNFDDCLVSILRNDIIDPPY